MTSRQLLSLRLARTSPHPENERAVTDKSSDDRIRDILAQRAQAAQQEREDQLAAQAAENYHLLREITRKAIETRKLELHMDAFWRDCSDVIALAQRFHSWAIGNGVTYGLEWETEKRRFRKDRDIPLGWSLGRSYIRVQATRTVSVGSGEFEPTGGPRIPLGGKMTVHYWAYEPLRLYVAYDGHLRVGKGYLIQIDAAKSGAADSATRSKTRYWDSVYLNRETAYRHLHATSIIEGVEESIAIIAEKSGVTWP